MQGDDDGTELIEAQPMNPVIASYSKPFAGTSDEVQSQVQVCSNPLPFKASALARGVARSLETA
jgi:hypothetical protein